MTIATTSKHTVDDLFEIMKKAPWRSSIRLIQIALSQGGYIAGGFARSCLRCIEGIDPIGKLYDYTSHGGDVDVFFPDNSSYEKAVEQTQTLQTLHNMRRTPTPGGHTFQGGGNPVVQFIGCTFGAPHDVLESFDIANAKVAFTATCVVHDDRWHALEKEALLHVDVFDDVRTLRRITSWGRRHGFKGTTPETQALLNMNVERIMTQTSDLNATIPGTDMSLLSFYRRVGMMRSLLDEQTLMSLWMFVGNLYGVSNGYPDYVSWAEGEIRRRCGMVNRAGT